MAFFETSAQYDRDLRSVSKEWKRSKDSKVKWAAGRRPLSGLRQDWVTGEAVGGSESQRAKSRPQRQWTEPKIDHNIVKLNRGRANHNLPAGRVGSKMAAREEMDDVGSGRSISDLLPRRVEDPVLGFLRDECPWPTPLTLDAFVKTDGRDTEKLVEKEYEVLDENGDALKGRKARRNLRKGASSVSPASNPSDAAMDDDGFELV